MIQSTRVHCVVEVVLMYRLVNFIKVHRLVHFRISSNPIYVLDLRKHTHIISIWLNH